MKLVIHPQSEKRYNQIVADPPQSVLLIAPVGSGKHTLLMQLANDLLGDSPAGRLLNIEPEPDKKTIGIEQIRLLKNSLRLKSDKLRVITISNAGVMTDEAQNSLLKILEEPPVNSVFLLSVNTAQDVLSTVRSRTSVWRLVPPAKQQLLDHFTGHDMAKIEKAYVISDGRVGLMASLLTGDTDHPLMHAIDTAKELLAESHFERLVRVDALSKDPAGTNLLLEALVLLSKAALEHAATQNAKSVKQWHRRLTNATLAHDQLESNVQTKLVLSHLFVVV